MRLVSQKTSKLSSAVGPDFLADDIASLGGRIREQFLSPLHRLVDPGGARVFLLQELLETQGVFFSIFVENLHSVVAHQKALQHDVLRKHAAAQTELLARMTLNQTGFLSEQVFFGWTISKSI